MRSRYENCRERWQPNWLQASCCLLLFLLPLTAGAQEISLSEAIEIGLEKNFSIRVEEKRRGIATVNNTWGIAGRYPTLSLSLNSNNRVSSIDNPASFLNGQFSNIGATGTVNAAWTIFNGFRVRITKERLEQLEAMSFGNAALVVENTLQAIILEYYACLLEAEKKKVLEANLRLSRDRFHYALTRKELGTGVSFEVLNAMSAYYADSSDLIMQTLNLENQRRGLSQLLGFGPESIFIPSDSLQDRFPDYGESELRAKMLSNNQTLRNQFINLEILQKDADLARSSLMPSLNVNAGSNYSLSRFQLESFDPRAGKQVDYYVNFSLNFTLFNGGNVRRAIETAQIGQQVGRLNLREIQLSMGHQLASAHALYEARQKMLYLAEAGVSVAGQNAEIAEDKFKSGTLSSFDYRDVQMLHLRASINRIQAVFNLIDAQTQLLRITGGILDAVEGMD